MRNKKEMFTVVASVCAIIVAIAVIVYTSATGAH